MLHIWKIALIFLNEWHCDFIHDKIININRICYSTARCGRSLLATSRSLILCITRKNNYLIYNITIIYLMDAILIKNNLLCIIHFYMEMKSYPTTMVVVFSCVIIDNYIRRKANTCLAMVMHWLKTNTRLY